jgi:peptidoglycan-associated lipoprotein
VPKPSPTGSSRTGIARARISTRGWGETAPVAPNQNPDGSNNDAGMVKNRRVVVSVATN